MKKTKYGVFPIVGIIAGVIVIFLGLGLIGSGDTANYASFGGDFYSYSYKATRYAANNLSVLIDAIAYLIIAFGLFDITYFGCKLVDNKIIVSQQASNTEEYCLQQTKNYDHEAFDSAQTEQVEE